LLTAFPDSAPVTVTVQLPVVDGAVSDPPNGPPDTFWAPRGADGRTAAELDAHGVVTVEAPTVDRDGAWCDLHPRIAAQLGRCLRQLQRVCDGAEQIGLIGQADHVRRPRPVAGESKLGTRALLRSARGSGRIVDRHRLVVGGQ
jgi:hypothetical protein